MSCNSESGGTLSRDGERARRIRLHTLSCLIPTIVWQIEVINLFRGWGNWSSGRWSFLTMVTQVGKSSPGTGARPLVFIWLHILALTYDFCSPKNTATKKHIFTQWNKTANSCICPVLPFKYQRMSMVNILYFINFNLVSPQTWTLKK